MVVTRLTTADRMLIKKYNVKDVRVTLESIGRSSDIDQGDNDFFNDNIFENLLSLKPSTSYSEEQTNSEYSTYKLNFVKTVDFSSILDVFMKDISIESHISVWSKDIPFVDECKLRDSLAENHNSLEFENISQSTLDEATAPVETSIIAEENFDSKLDALPLNASNFNTAILETRLATLNTANGLSECEKSEMLQKTTKSENSAPTTVCTKPIATQNGHSKKIKLQLTGYRIPKKQKSEASTDGVTTQQSCIISASEESKLVVPALQIKDNNSIFRTIMNSVQSGVKKQLIGEIAQPVNNQNIVKENICNELKKRRHSPSPSRIGVKKARNDAARCIIAQSKNILNKQSPAKCRKHARSKEQSCNVQKSFILSRPLPDLDSSYEPKSILRSPTRAKSNKKVLFNDGRNEMFHIKRLLDCHLYQDESSMEVVTQKQCSSLSTMDQFLLAILRWNPIWFNEYIAAVNSGHEANLPPIFNENLKLEKEMPTTFESFNKYQQAMLPFVILEVWDNACCCKTHDAFNHLFVDGLVCPAKDTTSIEIFQDYYVRAIVPRAFHSFDYEHLVEFSFTNLELNSCNCFLGFIRDFSYQPLRSINEVAANMKDFAPQESISDFKFVNFTIRAKAKANIPRNYHGHLRVQGIMPLSKYIRYIETLSYVCYKQINAVLNGSSVISEVNPALKEPIERFDANSLAQCCVDFVYSESLTNSIHVHHFEANANRSNHIADVVEALQQEKLSKYTSNGRLTKKCAILILCSNNALLNFTSRRILSKIQKHKMADPEKRVGDDDEANKPESQIKAADLQAEIGHIKANLLMLQNVHEDGTSPQSTTKSPEAEISQMESKLKELESKLKKCRDKRVSKTAVHRQRCTIIFHADVVAMSLNDCANPMENSILSDENKPVKFSCAIIDEAQLNSELETLLPLKYGVEKLILFGSTTKNDDRTLKPNLAKHCNFDSLFQRLKLKNSLPVS